MVSSALQRKAARPTEEKYLPLRCTFISFIGLFLRNVKGINSGITKAGFIRSTGCLAAPRKVENSGGWDNMK